MDITTGAANSQTAAFFALIKNPVKFRLFLLKKLPAAYFSGLRIHQCNDEKCTVSVPYKWFTTNPFRSTYFACLSMAAEMSTGILAMANVYQRKPAVSMLVVGVEGKFYKKATGKTKFTCEEGSAITNTIGEAINTKSPQSIRALSSGYNEQNELV